MGDKTNFLRGGRRDLWFKEWFTPNESHSHKIKGYLVRKKTKFQEVHIYDTFSFGKCLVIDGEIQSAQLDEFIYHESLTHPSMLTHPCPENILIMGGGEGATARELLKHKTIKKIMMVDIDGGVVNFCKKYLTEWHQGSFSNKKIEIIIDDAKKIVETTNKKFDVIISDLPSPIESGPVYKLYTIEFYKVLIKKLKDNGIFVLQAGSGNLLQIHFHLALYKTLKKIFKFVSPYYSYVPSFDVPWAFIMASQKQSPLRFTEKEIDRKIREKIKGTLKFYDGMTHKGLFRIPKYLRTLLEEQRDIITLKKPVFFYN